jgi:electron transport complex protein RnfB
MMVGVLLFVLLAAALSVVLVAAARLCGSSDDGIVDQIEACLPHIQCAQCGFPGCRPYAEAIASEQAPINLCPPGGMQTVRRLADLLSRDVTPVDDSRGHASLDHVALIDERACIGCNLCARACPVDAIAGIPQMMHTVIADACTGCELCLAPCPVDCIDMVQRR